jgi:hypothetical protein
MILGEICQFKVNLLDFQALKEVVSLYKKLKRFYKLWFPIEERQLKLFKCQDLP